MTAPVSETCLLTCLLLALIHSEGVSAENETISDRAINAPCGVASLFVVAKVLDVDVTFESLKDLLGPTPDDGLHSFEALQSAATRVGLFSLAVHSASRALPNISFPAILQIENPSGPHSRFHFLVALGVNDGRVKIVDAPFGPAELPAAEVERLWTGNALILAPSADLLASIETEAAWQRYSTWMCIPVCALLCLVGGLIGVEIYRQVPAVTRGHLYRWVSVAFLCGSAFGAIVLMWCLYSNLKPYLEVHAPAGLLELGQMKPGLHTVRVELRNSGLQQLRIHEVRSSCSCADVQAPSVINALQSSALTVSLKVGAIDGSAQLEIISNDARGAQTVAIHWRREAAPYLAQRAINILAVRGSGDATHTVDVLYPGGKGCIIPRLKWCTCDSPLVHVTEVANNPNAIGVSRLGLGPTVLGGLTLAVVIKNAAAAQSNRLNTVVTGMVEYGTVEVPFSLPICAKFVGPRLCEADPTITFSSQSAQGLLGQVRTIECNLDNLGGRLEVDNVPEWVNYWFTRAQGKGWLHFKVVATPRSGFVTQYVYVRDRTGAKGEQLALLAVSGSVLHEIEK